MESLTVFSKYIGCYDRWQEIRKRYSLHWSNGNESLQALQKFFNPEMSLDQMIAKIKEVMCDYYRPLWRTLSGSIY